MDTAAEHLRLMGSSVDHPSGIVNITAPVSGVITDQEVTNAAGVQSLGTSPFTISDLSIVWIVLRCLRETIYPAFRPATPRRSL